MVQSSAQSSGALRRLVERKGVVAELPKGLVQSKTDHPLLYHEKNRNGKNRKGGRSNEKLPDAVELSELQQTQNTYKSNIFKLQVDQLLKEVSVDFIKLGPLEGFLKTLKSQIDGLMNVEVGNDLKQRYPFVEFVLPPSQVLSLGFSFQPPSRSDLVGSYLLKSVTRPNLNIDMTIEMPASMFQPKDHLNYRYFNKRSAYIAEVYRQLRDLYPYCRAEEDVKNGSDNSKNKKRKEKNESEIRPYFFLQGWQGDVRRPIIVIKSLIRKNSEPTSEDSRTGVPKSDVPTEQTHKMTSWTIRIFPVPPPNTFPEHRLSPFRNNVRFCSTSGTPDFLREEFAKQDHAEGVLPATPMYNGAILEDMRMVSWLHRFNEICEQCPGFIGAVKLIKIWGRQRGYCSSWASNKINNRTSDPTDNTQTPDPTDNNESIVSPVSGFLLTVICAHVCTSDKAGMSRASPIQIFKLAMTFLSQTDFDEKKVMFGVAGAVPMDAIEQKSNLKLFMDFDKKTNSEMTYNIFWAIQLSLDDLRGSAQESIRVFDSLEDPFDELFGNRYHASLFLNWDISILAGDVPDVNCISAASCYSKSDEFESQRSDDNSNLNFQIEHPLHFQIASGIETVLRRGLTDRIQKVGGIDVRFACPGSWTNYNRSNNDCCHRHPIQPPPFSWTDISIYPSDAPAMMRALVSVVLSSETGIGETGGVGSPLWRLVDRGVPANSHLAKHFKAFWGNSSVRRFQDGSINQSIVWNRPTPTLENLGLVKAHGTDEAFVAPVPSQIVHHLITRHFGSTFEVEGSQITDSNKSRKPKRSKRSVKGRILISDAVLGIPNRPTSAFVTPSGDVVPHPITHFSELKTLFIGLTDLPLDIKELRSAEQSGILGHSDTPVHCAFPTESQTTFTYASENVVECVVEFGKSGGWPTEVDAVKRMKAALLVSIRSALLSSSSINSEIGGLSSVSNLTDPFLDVVYPPIPSDGGRELETHQNAYLPRMIYRVRVFHPFEHLTIATALSEIRTDVGIAMDTSSFAAISDVRDLWWRPIICSLLHNMALKYTAFAPSIRLVKVWCSSHLFPLDKMNDLIGHLMLHLFNNPSPHHRQPTTPHSAFARFLHLLIDHPWSSSGLYISADPNCPSVPYSTLTQLHDVYKRRRVSQNTADICSQSTQSPLLWISSTLDPYCQFIQLPTLQQSHQLLRTAKESLSQFHKFSSHYSPKSQITTTESQIISPHLNFLPKSSWRQLFVPCVLSRFDFVINLTPTVETVGKFNGQKKEEEQKPKLPFKNLKKSQTVSIPVSAIRELGDVKIGNDGDQKNIQEASDVLGPVLQRSRKSKSSKLKSKTDEFIDRVVDASQSQLSDTHSVVGLLQDSFAEFIKNLRNTFEGICDFYFDSLALPYPPAVYVSVNPEAIQPLKLSPAFATGCPKTFFQLPTLRHDDSSSDNSSDENDSRPPTLVEIPNSVLMIGIISSLGSSIVHDIQIL